MQKRVFFIVLMVFFALSTMAEGLIYLSTEDFKKKQMELFYEQDFIEKLNIGDF